MDQDTTTQDAQTPVAAVAAKQMVKIRTIRECLIGDKIVPGNTEVMATEEEAAEYCDKKFQGYHPFYGHMPEIGPLMGNVSNPLERRDLVRAVRVL